MNKQTVRTDKAPKPIGPYSQAVTMNNMIFVSGQVALDPTSGELLTNGIANETERVMRNLQSILNAAGFDFHHVVKSTIFLKDMDDFNDMNTVYGAYFTSEPPARETVQVSKLPRDANVEISVIAMK